MNGVLDYNKITAGLCLRIVAKCYLCQGTPAKTAACQNEDCPLHIIGPGLALMDLSAGSDGHAGSH